MRRALGACTNDLTGCRDQLEAAYNVLILRPRPTNPRPVIKDPCSKRCTGLPTPEG
jgi:hypothetical protein